MGSINQVYAQYLKEILEVEPDLIMRIRTELQRRKILLKPPTCRTYLPPRLSDEETVDHSSIKTFIRATAKFIGVDVDDEKEDYKRARNGVYASMGLECPDKLREEAPAKRQKK